MSENKGIMSLNNITAVSLRGGKWKISVIALWTTTKKQQAFVPGSKQ